jgi:hypothetical protein
MPILSLQLDTLGLASRGKIERLVDADTGQHITALSQLHDDGTDR